MDRAQSLLKGQTHKPETEYPSWRFSDESQQGPKQPKKGILPAWEARETFLKKQFLNWEMKEVE
jgi:hypothetical protein